MFSSVLIANRGLIQANCVRAVKELGCRAVTVYDSADRHSAGVRNADEAHELHTSNARIPYQDIDQIVDLATRLDIEAVHPGYGFLAQNVEFRQRLAEKSIKFIGASHNHEIELENKPAVRDLAVKSGIPILPGTGPLESLSDLHHQAEELGLPLMMKACEGYGGLGIRLVERLADIEAHLRGIQAQTDRILLHTPQVYLEKYLPNARLLEIPVARDTFGNVVFFPERDCTIQRRFRKVVVETPSEALPEAVRNRLRIAVQTLLDRLDITGFVSADFLYDGNQAYFLELNDYIQPSHSVSSLLSDVDIIREQVSLATGQSLSFRQNDIATSGVAMSVFLSAEDPDQGFAPSPGIVERLLLPFGDGVYSQTNVFSGDRVGTEYDPIIGMIMVKEKNRAKAIDKLRTAVDGAHIDGIRTNIPLLRALLRYPDFIQNKYDTSLITDAASRESIFENFRTTDESAVAALIAALSIQRDANHQILLDQVRQNARSKIWDMATDWLNR